MKKTKKGISRRLKLFLIDRQFFAFLCLLFYPFNNTIVSNLIYGAYIPYILFAIGVVLLIPDFRQKITKNNIKVCGIIGVLIVLLVVNNRIFETSLYNISTFVIQILYILLALFMLNLNIKTESLLKAIGVYSVEHLIGTSIPILAPKVYETEVLGFICKGRDYCIARSDFKSGLNAGFTSIYSTNGCYLVISALLFAALSFKKKQKRYYMFLLLSVIDLLIIGKRAHLIFALIAILFGFFQKDRKNYTEKIIKVLVLILIALIGFVVAANYFPMLGTTVNRILESGGGDDVTNGRLPLYSFALELWQKRPIFGNGWGAFIAASHTWSGINSHSVDYIHVHNDYLEILCDCGVVGLIFYLLVLQKLFKKISSPKQASEVCMLIKMFSVFYAIYGFTGTPLYTPCLFTLLILSITISLKKEEV